ncbi:hypothetical protein F5B22DRAFT_618286 [Xylaria bambusicola]|uniref:uncharacterized protein n=1 Tax=Xylaria bambusicola TaxID=326684 RepID=UPI0020088D9D|nr:uncharacterized protein F5B22DRAFT_618286 [Xylaria bambusicola]KAI0509056.1 hypothetical protein F5B22DRAFT_618286 [Xylaria bambusicola]
MGLHNTLAIPRMSPIPSILARLGPDARRNSLVLLAVVALLPATYAAYVLRQGATRTVATARISPPEPLRATEDDDDDAPSAVPSDVHVAPERYVVGRERVVSEDVPLKRLLPGLREGKGEGKRGLLETYLGTTMRTFTWTPQAFVMKALVSRLPGGAALAETFSATYLDACCFQPGDRVCGVYVVRERVASEGGERVFLDLSAPEGWKGPVVTGVLDCGYVLGEENGEKVVRFVNETVLWRTTDGKPTLLEGKVSRWLHTAMIGWMMVRGVEAVTGRTKGEME